MKGHSTPKKKNKNDRRQATRFTMNLPVRYCSARGLGWGKILNISSVGALLTINHPDAARGDLVELYIGWPVLLDDRVHLNLVAKGSIVRVGENCAAVKFEKCDLRTCSSTFLRHAVSPEVGHPEDLAPASHA